MPALITPFCLLSAALLICCSTAQAQLFRAYLSIDGSDANPCTVQAPCRLLPAALAAVKDGGEIWMLDSANFNTAPVIITKSVSILAIPGALASIVGSDGDAILINGVGAKVALRNLKILNFNAGQNGIHMSNGAALKVEDCEIAGFATPVPEYAGIKVKTAADVTIVDSTVRDNYHGIWFDGGARGSVARTTVVGNAAFGIAAYPTVASIVTVMVSDSVSSNNVFGFIANGPTGSTIPRMTVVRSTAAHNSSGFATVTGTATMVVSGSVASNNFQGFFNTAGTLRSLGDNTVFNNTGADAVGTITATAPL